jgi:hypothetical protein
MIESIPLCLLCLGGEHTQTTILSSKVDINTS